jgi:hypothetical protein
VTLLTIKWKKYENSILLPGLT